MSWSIWQRVFAVLAALCVIVAVIWGLLIVGAPSSARLRKLDDRRVEDLRAIHEAIQRMVLERTDKRPKLRRALPRRLEEVAAYVRSEEYQRELTLHDPETREPYAYNIKGETEYELCATFSLPRERKQDLFWNHPAGRHCFVFNALDDATR